MAIQPDRPDQTEGNLAAAVALSFPVLGWFFSPFVLIILLTRANTLSSKRGRDMLLLLAAAAIHAYLINRILNIKGDDMMKQTLVFVGIQVAVLFAVFVTLSKNFKVWAWKGENSPWSG